MKVAVIILNYNSSNDCRKCVSFLKRQEGVELELVLVDNCSPDGDKVKALCREQGCTFIASHENRGYNAGNNIGLRYAAEKGYKYALIANPDMEFPQTDYVKRLVEAIETDCDIAICGSNILGVNNDRQNPWKFPTFWDEIPITAYLRQKTKYARNEQPNQNAYCDIVTGCCFLVNINIIKQIGYLDENVFLYCEEAILGKQIKLNGKKIFYLHNAVAYHRHIESQKGNYLKRFKAFWKSKWYYLKRYSGYKMYQLLIIYTCRQLHYILKYIQITITKHYDE